MTTDKMDVDSTVNDVQASLNDMKLKKIAPETALDTLIKTLKELSKINTTMDSRYVWRSLKELARIRREGVLTQESLTVLISMVYPDESTFKLSLLKYVNDNHKSHVKDADAVRSQYPVAFYQVINEGSQSRIEVSPIINSFIHLLVQMYLLDSKKYNELNAFNIKTIIPTILQIYNDRSLDLINAKLWFYIVIVHEHLYAMNSDSSSNNYIRSEMIKFLRIVTLKHDNETKAMLITLILRNYLITGEVNLASDFVSKLEFPTGFVSSPLEARYYFYLSKINAIQLNYSTANEYIIASIRKAPHNHNSLGFLQQANKLHGVIQLLMGDIPELSFFYQENMERSLHPYYHLTNTVKLGDLHKFTNVLTKFKAQLIKDGNYQLCVRLRSNVIKTGIRIISLTYKKISLKDICLKLSLDSEQTVEYMVSRSIRDGVIEASINHEEGYIETTELLNIYYTKDPQNVFDERIKFVNQLHDESVLSMRYPEDKKKKNKSTQQDDLLNGDIIEEVSDFSDLDDMDFL